MKVKVGIMTAVFMGWEGGTGLLNNFNNALRLNKDIDLIFLVPKNLGGIQTIDSKIEKNKILAKYRIKKILKNTNHKKFIASENRKLEGVKKQFMHRKDEKFVMYDNTPSGLVYACLDNKLDVIFPVCGSLGKDFPLPWVGYIWDLQHTDMPEYFKKEDIKQRNDLFSKIVKDSKSIIVNAEDVKNKVIKNYGGKEKVDFPPFSPGINKDWLDVDIAKIKKKYKLKNNYFICSNQLWIHKDHRTMFRALADLKKGNVDIVLTGLLKDHRNPKHKDQLIKLSKDLGIEKRIHWLGFVTKLDQVGLMKGSIAVIQPTLYEGGPGGGSAANAIALGKRIILSDIPVNKEIKNPLAIFFEAGNFKDLSLKMNKVINTNEKIYTNQNLISNGKKYKTAQSRKIVKIIKRAMV